MIEKLYVPTVGEEIRSDSPYPSHHIATIAALKKINEIADALNELEDRVIGISALLAERSGRR